jgi:hypothetical protein
MSGDDPSNLKAVPSTESFRVYRSGGGKIIAYSYKMYINRENTQISLLRQMTKVKMILSAAEDSSSTDEEGSSQQGGDSDSDESQSSNGAASNGKVFLK